MSEETGVQQEGLAFPEETETSTDSPTETKPEETTQPVTEDKPEDVKTVPFNEDPKIQEYINRQVENRIQGALIEKFKPQDEIRIPSYWNQEDVDGYKQFLEDQRRLVQEAEERAVQRIKAEREGEEKRIRDANEWFEKSVSDIESNGFKVDRNRLLKTAMDFELVDTQGRWNYKAAAEILKREEKPIDLTEKKQVAASATSEPTPERKPKDYLTPGILRRKGWG